MESNIARHLRQCPSAPASPHGRWLVGFSGGLDSTVLLHALVAADFTQPVVALHINHGLSPNADLWEQHCRAFCAQLGVPFIAARARLDTGSSVEERARRVRYAFFADHMRAGDCLVLAHHQNDQAETLLYRLLRGAGVRGLAAMEKAREYEGGQLLRPLLDVSRAELAAYGRHHQLSWIEDESNTDERFDRNFLRHRVLPELTRRWPQAPAAMARSAHWCREANELLSERAFEDLARLDERPEFTGASVSRTALLGLSRSRRNNVLRHWLEARFDQWPGHQCLEDVEAQLLSPAVSHRAQVASGNSVWCVFSDRLAVLDARQQWQPDAATANIPWPDSAASLALPGGDSLSWQPAHGGEALAVHWLDERVEVRWRAGGERCRPYGRGHSQSLKKLLQERDVPTWLRSRLPLIYINGQLAAVADLWVCHDFAAPAGAAGVELKWQV